MAASARSRSGIVRTRTTTRADGDFAIGAEPDALAARRRAVIDHPWLWLDQVHGAEVVTVAGPADSLPAGRPADAAVTTETGVVLAIQTADCVPVVLWSANGVLGAAHAGWRGLEADVIGATWAAMVELGAEDISWRIGPHIGVECYEFGAELADRLVARFGDRVRGRTAEGRPALDLGEATRAALEQASGRTVPPVVRPASAGVGRPAPGCTACHPERWYSHRARAEPQRMATVIWRDEAAG